MDKIKITSLETVKPTMLEMGFSQEKFTKEAGFVCQVWNEPKNTYLRKASKESLLSAVISIAQTGLTLNPVSKQAYLIPRASNGVVSAHLEPSYIGLVKLLTDAGQVKNLQTNLVHEGDDFDVNLGMGIDIKHKPHYVTGKPKGKIIGVYTVANLSDGNQQYEYMTREEVEEIRGTSESYKAYINGKTKSTIWVQFEGEMFRKTCIKRIAKHLPRSEQFEKAETLSNRDFEMQWWQFNKIEQLLSNSTILEAQKEDIEKELPAMNYSQANKAIEFLSQNQRDAIESGNNYQAEDINRKLDEKINDPKS